MRTVRHGMTLAAFMWVSAGSAIAGPPPADMLKFQPKQLGVIAAMPTEAEAASYKVELVTGPGPASGWALKDARGQMVRKFVASKGAKAKIDVWSYYLDGQEVYREIDTTESGKPDNFRWFGVGGMRWGVDVNKDLRIDGWKMISAEEVSQEVLKAISTRDAIRFQSLLINEAEIKALGFAAADADRIRQSLAQAGAKFNQTVQAVGNFDKAQWLQLEVPPPQCMPGESMDGKQDIFQYRNAMILFENVGKNDWISLGEMVQVGRAWRLVGGPVQGRNEKEIAVNDPNAMKVPAAVQALVKKLQDVDQSAPKVGSTGAAVAKYNLERAAVLEQIVAGIPGKDGEQWVKQLADSLSAAAQNSGPEEKAPLQRLKLLLAKLESENNPVLAAYVAFRVVNSEFMPQLQAAKPNAFAKIQDDLCVALKQFVTKYPQGEDTPDALLQVGMINEFGGKESDAKVSYAALVKDYAQHPLAPKANGALKRLGLEGQPLELAGPTFGGGQFNIAQFKGKIVVAFYWASWNASTEGDFTKLKALLTTYGPKDVVLVTVNLDQNQQGAVHLVQKAQLPGQHVFGAAGLDDPLATNYGIMVLPNIFLVGKDGKVVSRTVQMNSLDDEIKKLTDK